MIAVLGLGFVGLTSAVGFAEKNNLVKGYDVNKNKVNLINSGKIPFHEVNLQDRLKSNLEKNNLVITSNLKEVFSKTNIVFICVGTPNNKDGSTNLDYIFSALDIIIENKTEGFVTIVIKSTVPPSTCSIEITNYLKKKNIKIGEEIGIANNPEFLREGNAWDDFINPDRIVIGVEDKKSKNMLSNIYSNFGCPLHTVNLNTGEFIKYLSNTMLSTFISYSNEMSIIADNIGNIDVRKSFQVLKEDKRWIGNPATMTSYVYPGCGFGGYCLPKDTKALINKSKKYNYNPKILESVMNINQEIKDHMIKKIIKVCDKNSRIGILGLSFKPNSDDVRDTPALPIIQGLLKKGYDQIYAYDPISNENFQAMYNNYVDINYLYSLEKIIEKCDTLVKVTSWKEFENLKLAPTKKYIDLR
jgi:UDPglucose 6-dehydrogenase